MEVLKPHLIKVYNNRKEKSTFKSLNDSIDDAGVPPTFAEFEPDLEGLANDKAPSENGVSPNLIKALDTNIREIIYNKILESGMSKSTLKAGTEASSNGFTKRDTTLHHVTTTVTSA